MLLVNLTASEHVKPLSLSKTVDTLKNLFQKLDIKVKSIKDWHIALWLQMELQACGLRIDRRQYKSVIVDKVCADLSFFHPQNLLLPRGQ